MDENDIHDRVDYICDVATGVYLHPGHINTLFDKSKSENHKLLKYLRYLYVFMLLLFPSLHCISFYPWLKHFPIRSKLHYSIIYTIFTIMAFTGMVLFSIYDVAMISDTSPYCCYPPGMSYIYGKCSDPSSDIHKLPDIIKCRKYNIGVIIMACIFSVLYIAHIIYVGPVLYKAETLHVARPHLLLLIPEILFTQFTTLACSMSAFLFNLTILLLASWYIIPLTVIASWNVLTIYYCNTMSDVFTDMFNFTCKTNDGISFSYIGETITIALLSIIIPIGIVYTISLYYFNQALKLY